MLGVSRCKTLRMRAPCILTILTHRHLVKGVSSTNTNGFNPLRPFIGQQYFTPKNTAS